MLSAISYKRFTQRGAHEAVNARRWGYLGAIVKACQLQLAVS